MKDSKVNEVVNPKKIPNNKLHLFLNEDERNQKKNSHDDWKLVKRVKEKIKEIYERKNMTVPSINSGNYLKVISPILTLQNSEEEQELFKEENQEEQVDQPIENTGVIAEQQVETQLETQENNEEAVDDGEQVQPLSEDTVNHIPEY